jgi:pseudouridine synthase
MLLTNDGDFAYRLTHPKYEVAKTYEVLVKGKVDEQVLQQLRNGVELDDGKTAACRVRMVREERGGLRWLEFVLHEGRKRQIRRMCALEHLFVEQLVRVQIGDLRLKLDVGEWRELTEKEIVLLH